MNRSIRNPGRARILFAGLTALLVLLTACAAPTPAAPTSAGAPSASPGDVSEAGTIFLYGEQHGVKAILDRELALWTAHYRDEGMRHLFVEQPYFTAAYLNRWMQAGDDEILNAVYADWEGTASHAAVILEFYQAIKRDCPETVFHGTDVGHQYWSTGARYLALLEREGGKDTEDYARALEAVEQGRYYYEHQSDAVYRENTMTQNFLREYAALDGADVMGVYGSAHTGISSLDFSGQVSCMAAQLHAVYGEAIRTEDLSVYAKEDVLPLRTDAVTVAGKTYEASYFGEEDLTRYQLPFTARAFWRLENAYADFADAPQAGDVLPNDNYPMQVEAGQVFVIDYTNKDGSVERHYYRADGSMWNGRPTTVEITPEA